VQRDALRAAWGLVPTRYRQYAVGPLGLSDVPQIADLERRVFPEPMPARTIAAKIVNPRTVYLGVRHGPVIAAFFGFEVWGRYAHVLANVTHPRYRRQGLATFVLTAAEPLALALGARGFLGEVRRSNVGQQQVLNQIGWRVVFEIPGFFLNGEDALIVWRPLPGEEQATNR